MAHGRYIHMTVSSGFSGCRVLCSLAVNNTQQVPLPIEDSGPDLERLREYEADLTPEPVVHQWLVRLRDVDGLDPRSMLDPSAGDGVFGKVARQVWPDVRIVAVEPRPECREYLVAHCDVVETMSLEAYLARGTGWFDLIVTNPPFTLALRWVPMLRRLLGADGLLSFLQLSELGQRGLGKRGEDSCALFDANRPTAQFRIPGAIGYRGPGINPKTNKPHGADMRSYSWWMWTMLSYRQGWHGDQLPRLPSCDRKWLTPPGRP